MYKLIDNLLRRVCKIEMCKRYKLRRNEIQITGPIYIKNNHVSIGKNVFFCRGARIYGDGDIIIGNNVSIGDNTIIFSCAPSKIIIEDDTMIGANSYIINCDHKHECCVTPFRLQGLTTSDVIISKGVWLGQGVTVLKGVTIASKCVVGAGSVVVKTLPDEKTIYCGVPAIKKKYIGESYE